MTDLSHKTVCFYDVSGSYTHMAEAVVGDFARVLYYSELSSGFPIPKNLLPGYGVDGIERIGPSQSIEDFWDAVEVSDLVVFTDVGNYGLTEYLRSQGVPVFGSGQGGRLEQDRLYLKSACRKLGLDVADYFPLRGLDPLRRFLLGDGDSQPSPECFVKLSFWRGLKETFRHDPKDLATTRSHLLDLELEAGPYAEEIEFCIEQPIDDEPCVEVGIDTNCADGAFPETIMWGYEASKDNCYVGTVGALPPRLAKMVARLSPELGRIKYRGPISTETRECDKKSYFLDFTARFPEPPSSLRRFMVSNWAEIYWEYAHGRVIEEDYVAPVGVQIVLKSDFGKDHPLALQVGRPDRVTIHGHCVLDGRDYAVSPAEIQECVGACGLGTTLEDALEDAIDAAESVHGREVVWDRGALEKISEAIEKGNELGLT